MIVSNVVVVQKNSDGEYFVEIPAEIWEQCKALGWSDDQECRIDIQSPGLGFRVSPKLEGQGP